MPAIRIEGLHTQFLENVNLTLAAGELMVLLGPSGAGKTSLLNAVAGLAKYRGHIFFGDHCVDRLPPHNRAVGYLFQELFLFPHLTVQANLRLAMQRLRLSSAEQIARLTSLLERFKLMHLARRYPHEISGGEKQLVAMARAVATEPAIMLLDEPFGHLDYRSANYLRQVLKQMQSEMGLTMLFVTHHLGEARELAHRLAVMRAGRIEQVGTAEELWLQGATDSGGFLESANVLACACQRNLANGLVEFQWAGIKLLVPDEGRTFDRVAIRPRDVYISSLPPPGPSINRFQARIESITPSDGTAAIVLRIGANRLRAVMNIEPFATLQLAPGDRVYGILKLRALYAC